VLRVKGAENRKAHNQVYLAQLAMDSRADNLRPKIENWGCPLRTHTDLDLSILCPLVFPPVSDYEITTGSSFNPTFVFIPSCPFEALQRFRHHG